MTITSSRPAFLSTPLARASAPADAAEPADSFRASEEKQARSGLLKMAGFTLAGTGLGVYSGLSTGALAMLAGAGAGIVGGGVVGALAGGFLAEKVLHGSDESKVAGLVLGGGLVGLAVGLIGGAYVGSAVSSPLAAVGMGLLGGAGGFLQGALRSQ